MAKSTAERQKERRERLKAEREWRRLNLWIKADAHGALRRLAARDGVTIAEMIEKLATAADSCVLADLSEDELDQYFRDSVEKTGKARRK